MRIYPAVHYTMGGLWVDYNLMSTIPGLHVAGRGELLRSRRQPARRERADAGAGRRLLRPPDTIGDYLAATKLETVGLDARGGARRARGRGADARSDSSAINGKRTVDSFHRELGKIMWDYCGMARNADGLREGARADSGAARRSSGANVTVPGSDAELNQALEQAGRVADFLEFGELMCLDALHREESCGGHFREEHQTPDGEALRDDERFAYVAAWEYAGDDGDARAAQGAARVRERAARAAELQVTAMRLTLHVWRQPGRARRGGSCAYDATDISPGHVVPRDARRRQRAA